jgi:CsoR family transcriptional regulator, copper-sensing transcriptional repressor
MYYTPYSIKNQLTMTPMSKLTDPVQKKDVLSRLAKVEGQLRGIQKMIHEEQDCEKVAQQLAASRKALDKTFFTLLACVMQHGQVPPAQLAAMLAKYA